MALRSLILVAALAGSASAETYQATPRWELGFSIAGGGESIGDQFYGQAGMRFHLSRRIVPALAVAVRAELLTTNKGSGEHLVIGETVRLMTGLDWQVRPTKGLPVPELFVLGGMGTEHIAWDRGVVHRMLTYVGFEARQQFTIPKNHAIRGVSHMGMRYGIHLQVSRGVEPMTIAAACTNCVLPDRERGLDFAILGTYGIDFGR
jgi:hypothetical protein